MQTRLITPLALLLTLAATPAVTHAQATRQPAKAYTGSGSGDGDGGEPDRASASTTGDPIREAGESFLATLSEEEKRRPFDGGASDDDEGAGDGGDPGLGTELDNEDEGDGGVDNGDQGASIGPDEGAEARESDKEGGEVEDGKPVVVTLAGEKDRGEEDIEVEVDPDLAERIRRLQNEGLRGGEFKAQLQRVQAREAKLAEYDEALEVDPIGFHLERMPEAVQLDVARALIVEHLDKLQGDIDKFLADREELLNARLANRDTRDKAKQTLQRRAEARAHAQRVFAAVDRLIPKSTPADVAEDFVADARIILAEAARAGQRVDPTTVKRLLDRRIKLYGFDKPKQPAPKAEKDSKTPPAARPVSDKARAIADAAAARRPAADAQSRIRRIQAARAAASRVTPPGAGAAPVQRPMPKEAEADIASMSKHLRTSGLSSTWDTAGRE